MGNEGGKQRLNITFQTLMQDEKQEQINNE